MISDIISHYRIIKKIGMGGMGEVYLAEDTKLPRRVALKHMADRIAEFGADGASMTFVLLSFNRNPDSVRRDLRKSLSGDERKYRSYWTLFANRDKLAWSEENLKYVPRFFAAAVIGENPQVFDLPMPPLSTRTGTTK
jgi:serine/threonine protein kinase